MAENNETPINTHFERNKEEFIKRKTIRFKVNHDPQVKKEKIRKNGKEERKRKESVKKEKNSNNHESIREIERPKFKKRLTREEINDLKQQRKENIIRKINHLKQRSKFELMFEAFYIANLFYLNNKTNWNAFDDEYYIIPTSWFNRWKYYVNYDYLMAKTENFLKLNNLNENKEENYFETIDANIKPELNHFLQNFFISNNSEHFPGKINTKDLLYPEGSFFFNFNNKKSHLNYNINEKYENLKDYFIVNKPIWSFFKKVYGGKEIKRYSIPLSPNNEFVVEILLKNISTTFLKSKRDKLEKPKFVFAPMNFTLRSLKKYYKELFSFLSNLDNRDIRLWILDKSVTFEHFENYYLENLKKNKEANKKNFLKFPGICLDDIQGSEDVTLTEIEDHLYNKTLFIEYRDNIITNFILKRENYDLELNLKKVFSTTQADYNKYWQHSTNEFANYYDRPFLSDVYYESKKNEFMTNNQSFFVIKEFFKRKYLDFEEILFEDNEIDEIYNKEFNEIFDRSYLLFNKQELFLKFSNYYNISDNVVTPTLSRHEQILKRRERAKLLAKHEKPKKKEEQQTKEGILATETIADGKEAELNTKSLDKPVEKDEVPILTNVRTESKTEDENNLMTEKCKYCNKILDTDDEIEACPHCLVKYCNSACLNKDKKFHLKKCNK